MTKSNFILSGPDKSFKNCSSKGLPPHLLRWPISHHNLTNMIRKMYQSHNNQRREVKRSASKTLYLQVIKNFKDWSPNFVNWKILERLIMIVADRAQKMINKVWFNHARMSKIVKKTLSYWLQFWIHSIFNSGRL